MLQHNKLKILRLFFDYPTEDFHIRQISRLTKIAPTSVKIHINYLIKEGLLILNKKGIYPSYKANRDSELFMLYKKLDLIERIKISNLLKYIHDSCIPDCIILFGSASRGEDIEDSDIDLFIQAKEKKLSLEKYERLLNRKINLFFEENFARLNKELKNNIINGIKLKGYLKVF